MPIFLSVIIPTYNRRAYLQDALVALAQQTLPTHMFEVIVVDDGSTGGTKEVVETAVFPTALHYIWQENQGDATARNAGAAASQGDILLFLDDDILVRPNFLAQIVSAHRHKTQHIIVGQQQLWLAAYSPLTAEKGSSFGNQPPAKTSLTPLPFAEVCSNNMSLRRNDFFSLGAMEPLNFAGSDIWCDVDFSYRAYQCGFSFARCTEAHCYHRDYVEANLESKKKRMEEVAYRAVALFNKHPQLLPHLPMFADKTPPSLHDDAPRLLIRKLVRAVGSSKPLLWHLEKLHQFASAHFPESGLLAYLERWIIGGYIFNGYRRGLNTLFH